MTIEPTIEDVTEELYGSRLGDFVSARTAAAKAARAAGDAPLAKRIAALRKPTKAAWATNLLVRHEREKVDALLTLGTALRDAQDRLDAAELRASATRRRDLVTELVAASRRLAAEAGDPLADAGADAVATTLYAAVADARAAAALATGSLLDALTSTGFEPIDLDGLVALPEAVGDVGRPKLRLVTTDDAPQPRKTREPRPDRGRTARERTKEQTKAKSAPAKTAGVKAPKARSKEPPKNDTAVRAAQERLDLAVADAAEAQQRATGASAAVEELQRRRTALRDELAELDEAITRAQRDAKDASRDSAAAGREEARARRALDGLR